MTTTPLYKIPSGTELVLDGCHLRVVAKDAHGYLVEAGDTHERRHIAYRALDDAIATHKCTVTLPEQSQKLQALLEYTGGIRSLSQLPPEEQAAIEQRLAFVNAMIELEEAGAKLTQRNMDHADTRRSLLSLARTYNEKVHGVAGTSGGKFRTTMKLPKGRTLQKYLSLYRRYDGNPLALMHRDNKKGPQGDARKKLDLLQERFIAYAQHHWLQSVKPMVTKVCRDATDKFEEKYKDFVSPSITTLRKRLKQVSEVLKVSKREGSKQAWNNKSAGVTDIRAISLGERVEIDECCLSIAVSKCGGLGAKRIDPDKVTAKDVKGEIARIWLVMALDCATSMPLGWAVCDAPSAEHTKIALRMAMSDKTGLAKRYGCTQDPAPPVALQGVYHDNGSGLRNKDVTAALLGLNTTITHTRTYRSKERARVERFFHTFQHDVLNILPGYVGSRPGHLPGYDAVREAKLTPSDLYATLTRYLIDEYPLRPHTGTGMNGCSPRQKLRDVLANAPVLPPPSPENLRLHLGMTTECEITTEGVKIHKIPYNSTELQKFHDLYPHKKATVHLSPENLRQATVTFVGSDETVTVHLSQSEFKDLTLSEAHAVMRRAIERNPTQATQDAESLREARLRRIKESGYYEDPDLFDTYQITASQAQAQAELLTVEVASDDGRTTKPGDIVTRRSPSPETQAGSMSPSAGSQIFTPLTKGKL